MFNLTTSSMMDGLLLKFFGLDTTTNRSLQGQDKRYADVLIMPARPPAEPVS
jgi:hypothetical protein